MAAYFWYLIIRYLSHLLYFAFVCERSAKLFFFILTKTANEILIKYVADRFVAMNKLKARLNLTFGRFAYLLLGSD